MGTDRDNLDIQAMVNLLHVRKPEVLLRLRQSHKVGSGMLEPGKRLGPGGSDEEELLLELANETASIAKQECNEVFEILSRKLKISSRLRFGSGIVSSAFSGGMVAAISNGAAGKAALISGILAFASSCLVLASQLKEDYLGGENSFRQLSGRILDHLTAAFEFESELRLMNITGDLSDLKPAIRKINSALASTRQIRLLLS